MSTINNKTIKVGLVIMASGLGKRFGGNKLVAILKDQPLVKWILDTTEGLFDKRVVVTRSEEVRALCDSLGIDCILHELPNRNDTVRLGLSELMNEVDYCFFVPGDQPLISRDSVAKLITGAYENQDRIVRANYGETVGAPMGFPRKYFEELLHLPEGKGGNWVAKKNATCVLAVEVLNDYELWDVDTVEDLERIKYMITK